MNQGTNRTPLVSRNTKACKHLAISLSLKISKNIIFSVTGTRFNVFA